MKSGTISVLALGGSHEDKLYDTLQAMTPTNNVKTVHQTSLPHIESNLTIDSDYCRLPTTAVFLATKRKNLAPFSFD